MTEMPSTHSSAQPELPITIIKPARGWSSQPLRDLWEYRELLFFLVWRDVKVRYKQTVLGASWAILQPLLTTAIFALFFGRMAGMPSDGLPYPLFAFGGLLLWTFFAQALTHSSGSLVASSHLITKVYFPRLVIPVAAVIGAVLDLLVASPALAVFMAVHHVPVTPRILLAPLFVVLVIAAAIGAGLWLSALNVEYRDIRYTVPFLIQLWLFLSPIIYPTSSITSRLVSRGLPGWLVGLNPIAGAVEGFRWAMFGTSTLDTGVVAASCVVTVVLVISGGAYFRAVEREFADVV